MASGDMTRGGVPSGQNAPLRGGRAETGKLGGHLLRRGEGVIGEKGQPASGGVGPGDELARAGQQLRAAIDHAVQVEDEGVVVSHGGAYPRICWRIASTSLRSAVFSLTSRPI